ncbi:MAG: hypothetical protein ACKVP0_08670 [Pirellulaceae bacterium]
MKRLATLSDDRLAYREPLGWGVLFTAPLYGAALSFGLFMIGASGLLKGVFQGNDWIPLVIGLAVLAWMAYLAISTGLEWFSRIGVSIDRQAGTFTPEWGLLLPLPGSRRRLEGLDHVQITLLITQRGSRVVDVKYQVYLVYRGNDRVLIGRHGDYAPIRHMAEEVGIFLGLHVIDASRSDPVLLPNETLGKSLHELAGAPSSGWTLPPAPQRQGLTHYVQGQQIHFELPREGFFGCLLVWILAVCCLIAFLVYIWIDSKGVGWMAIIFYGTIGGLLAAFMYSMVGPSWTSGEVDPQGLRLKVRGTFFTSRTHIPGGSIRELRLEGCLLTVVWTEGRTNFGSAGISEAEARWLYAAIQERLSNPGEMRT